MDVPLRSSLQSQQIPNDNKFPKIGSKIKVFTEKFLKYFGEDTSTGVRSNPNPICAKKVTITAITGTTGVRATLADWT